MSVFLELFLRAWLIILGVVLIMLAWALPITGVIFLIGGVLVGLITFGTRFGQAFFRRR